MGIIEKEGVSIDRQDVGGSGDMLVLTGLRRDDPTKKVATIVKKGEEISPIYTEEQMKATIGLSSILAENGKIVKTEKK